MKYVCITALFFLSLLKLYPESLDNLGLKYGTDKSSLFHSYTKIYEKYFEPLREQPIKFLEIGFSRGASAHMWEEYFSNAQLFYIDIDLSSFGFLQNFTRTHLYFVNQENPAELSNFSREMGDFDIIIDDGGHTMNQQITSFKMLFPHLKSGGIYVIEDLHTSYTYQKNYGTCYGSGDPSQQTMAEFLQKLVHSVNKMGALTGCADFDKCPSHIFSEFSVYEKDIISVHFYCSLCFIFKR